MSKSIFLNSNKLKRLIESEKISKTEINKVIGSNPNYINTAINKGTIGITFYKKLCDFLGVSYRALTSYTDWLKVNESIDETDKTLIILDKLKKHSKKDKNTADVKTAKTTKKTKTSKKSTKKSTKKPFKNAEIEETNHVTRSLANDVDFFVTTKGKKIPSKTHKDDTFTHEECEALSKALNDTISLHFTTIKELEGNVDLNKYSTVNLLNADGTYTEMLMVNKEEFLELNMKVIMLENKLLKAKEMITNILTEV